MTQFSLALVVDWSISWFTTMSVPLRTHAAVFCSRCKPSNALSGSPVRIKSVEVVEARGHTGAYHLGANMTVQMVLHFTNPFMMEVEITLGDM